MVREIITAQGYLYLMRHTLGEKIRSLRKAKKLTLEELAGQVGVSQPFLSGVERGDKNPRLETLEGIAEALNVSPALLQHPDIDITRLHEISEIVKELSVLPEEKLDLVLTLLRNLQK